MSKQNSAEVSSSESSSLQNLVLEKHELQKQVAELDREIRQTQKQQQNKS